MEVILVPIFLGGVLPIAIVFIIGYFTNAKEKQKTDIIIKAIEANNNIDADKLAESLREPQKTDRQVLNSRLLRGCIFSLVGLFVCIVAIINLFTDYNYSAKDVTVTSPLILGGASIAVGISYLIVYFVTRKQVDNAEEK